MNGITIEASVNDVNATEPTVLYLILRKLWQLRMGTLGLVVILVLIMPRAISDVSTAGCTIRAFRHLRSTIHSSWPLCVLGRWSR